MDLDFGDVPTWVQAGATALLLLAASVAGWYTHRIYKIESSRDERYEDERRADQASKVAAWRGVVPFRPETPNNNAGTYGPVIHNGSELPIYQVQVELLPIGQAAGTSVYVTEVLPPGRWFVHAEDGDFYRTRPVTLHPGLGKNVPQYAVALRFRDAAGLEWRRDENGVLEHTGTTVFLKPATVEVTAGELTIRRGQPDRPRRWFHRWFATRKRT